MRPSDRKPLVSAREADPDWRGIAQGSTRFERVLAKTRLSTDPKVQSALLEGSLTAEEAAGILEADDPANNAKVNSVWAARHKVRKARRDNILARYNRVREEVAKDPYHWPCVDCYEERTADFWMLTDVLNPGSSNKCYKCSRPKPAPDSANFEHIRWKCIRCSIEWCNDFTISGSRSECPFCGEKK